MSYRLPNFFHSLRVLSRDKADTLLLLFACTIILIPHAWHLPVWMSVTCATFLCWRIWITARGLRLPPRWLLLPVSFLAMVGVYLEYKTFLGKDAGVAMLVLLLIPKLLEMHAKRDLFVVLYLSFFLILTNFFYTQSIGTAMLMAIAVIAMLTAQISFQYTNSAPSFFARLRFSALIFSLALPLTLILFFLFPRIQGPLWGSPSDVSNGRTGLSDSMTPGNISRLAQSDEVAFRVKFLDPLPPKSKLYWRAAVMGSFDGRTWKQLSPHSNARNQQVILNHSGAPTRYQVTLEPNGRRWLFSLEMPEKVPSLVGNPTGITADMQLLATHPIQERIRYDASSYLDFNLNPEESILALQDWLELPPGYNPKTLAFAANLQQQYQTAPQMLNAVLSFFRSENFSYTLEPPLLGKNSVDEFLFSTRAGFCEHYSSAFVVLMRSLGIPARVVTGYQGGEINNVDGFMTLRQSDAHAWAEVWLQNRGWVRVDPTSAVAPERIEGNLRRAIPRTLMGNLVDFAAGENSLLGHFRANWDALSNGWNQWILNYTPARQKNLVQTLGFDQVDWRTLTMLMVVLSILTVGLVGLMLLLNRRKMDPLNAVYFRFCQQMSRHGYTRAIHEGPRSYCARLAADSSKLSADKKSTVIQFLDLYESVQYGAAAQSNSIINRLKSLLAKCR